jgi:hypothetical protein
MADDYEDRFRRHEQWLKSFAILLQRQDDINTRLTAAIERIDKTLARLETLMTRVFRGEEGNGRDA